MDQKQRQRIKSKDKLTLELHLKNCVGNLNADPLHNITVLHHCIKHFDRM